MRACVYTHGVVHRSVGVSNTKQQKEEPRFLCSSFWGF